jgi:alpha-glucosidase
MGSSWQGAVIYQVCPRSFRDADGDGVGDLPGIIDGLPYIARLGVDALWITPFFPSPMRDFGYDVADYTGVDPRFGTVDDFDRLLDMAHRQGLKVVIDQVWGHTSDRHPWFIDSRIGRHGAKADWYVWAEAKSDGSPPNNWLSVFGGPAWTWDPRRRQYYLHHFLSCQPALNWRNPEVAGALAEAGAWWEARGVDGFRLDAVDFLLHDPALRDNPPRCQPTTPLRPFSLQQHCFDMAQPDLPALLEWIRGRFPRLMMVAELSGEPDPLVRAASFTGPHRLNMAYTLGLMKCPFSPEGIRGWIAEAEAKLPDGGLCWAFSNHDVERATSRWGDGSPAAAKLLLALLLSLRGGVCLYQGEELGLTEADVPFDRLQDPYGLTHYPEFKGRDGCRTPLPWRADALQAGFTTATPWLPIPDGHRALAIDRQQESAESVLAFARSMLHLRRLCRALRWGSLRLVDVSPALVAFERRWREERILCVFNPSPQPVCAIGADRTFDLGPWGVLFLKAKSGQALSVLDAVCPPTPQPAGA